MPGVSTTTVGSLTAAGATRAQRLEQQVGVVRDRRDAVLAEQLGEQPHHHLAVLEHVAHVDPSTAEPQPKKKPGFHRRGAEFTEFGIVSSSRNSLLCVLGASAVSLPKIYAGTANSNG